MGTGWTGVEAGVTAGEAGEAAAGAKGVGTVAEAGLWGATWAAAATIPFFSSSNALSV